MNALGYADFVKRTAALNEQDRVDLFESMLEIEAMLDIAMEKTGIEPATFDDGTLRAAVVEAIGKNPRAVADFKAGKDAAKMAIVGAVMKANKGVPNDMVLRLVDVTGGIFEAAPLGQNRELHLSNWRLDRPHFGVGSRRSVRADVGGVPRGRSV